MTEFISKQFSRLLADIKRAAYKYIAGALFLGMLSISIAVSLKAKAIYNAPKEIEELKRNDSIKFQQVFANDRTQVDNQIIMDSKLDSIINMLINMKNQININTEKIKDNDNDNKRTEDRLWNLKNKQ